MDDPAGLTQALGPDVAVVMLSHVNYRTGAMWEMPAVTAGPRRRGADGLGPGPLGRRGAGRPDRRRTPTSRWAAPTSTSTADRVAGLPLGASAAPGRVRVRRLTGWWAHAATVRDGDRIPAGRPTCGGYWSGPSRSSRWPWSSAGWTSRPGPGPGRRAAASRSPSATCSRPGRQQRCAPIRCGWSRPRARAAGQPDQPGAPARVPGDAGADRARGGRRLPGAGRSCGSGSLRSTCATSTSGTPWRSWRDVLDSGGLGRRALPTAGGRHLAWLP